MEAQDRFALVYDEDGRKYYSADGLLTDCIHCIRSRAKGVVMMKGKWRGNDDKRRFAG